MFCLQHIQGDSQSYARAHTSKITSLSSFFLIPFPFLCYRTHHLSLSFFFSVPRFPHTLPLLLFYPSNHPCTLSLFLPPSVSFTDFCPLPPPFSSVHAIQSLIHPSPKPSFIFAIASSSLLSFTPTQWWLGRPSPGAREAAPRSVLCRVTSYFYLKSLSRPKQLPFHPSLLALPLYFILFPFFLHFDFFPPFLAGVLVYSLYCIYF